MTVLNRRNFLAGSAASFAGATGVLGSLSAAAATNTTGYKALVCVFFKGGWDSADVVLPYDQASLDQLEGLRPGLFQAYANRSTPSSRSRDALLRLSAANEGSFGGRQFAFPPEFAELQSVFNSNDLAIVGNVGPLIEPTDSDSFAEQSVELPKRLFSHNDQQSTWQSLGTEGTRYGWGGRFVDAAIASDTTANPLYAAISTGGNDVFLSGETAKQFTASNGNSPRELNIVEREWLIGGNDRYDEVRRRLEAFYERDDFGHSNLMKQDFADISANGVANVKAYNQARASVTPLQTVFPESSLGRQLKTVVETVEARAGLNVSRQVFYVQIGGFDTHNNQASSMPGRLSEISQAFGAFREALVERNLWNSVTTFTASDFGRTTIDNGDGTDHGWGAHHLVMGGAVNGGRIYGDLPAHDLSLPAYEPQRGRMIPTTSVEQYAATLGGWFGLDIADLNAALPNLRNFAQTNIGFMSGQSA